MTSVGACVEHDDAVGEIDRLVDVVRHEENRHVELLTDLQHQVLEVAAGLGVHRRERLVHQQDRGLVRERARDRDALLHPAGELPGVVVEEARQADRLERPPRRAALRSGRVSFLCRSGSRTLLRTDVHGMSERLYSWKTSAISSGGAVTRRPRSSTSPRWAASGPTTHLSSVVLPQPEGPTTQTNSPLRDGEGDVADRMRRLFAAAVDLAERP